MSQLVDKAYKINISKLNIVFVETLAFACLNIIFPTDMQLLFKFDKF